MRTRTLILAVVALLVVFGIAVVVVRVRQETPELSGSSLGGAATHAVSALPARPTPTRSVTKLAVTFLPNPPYGGDFVTSGTYPQVTGVADLGSINGALRDLVVKDQRADQAKFLNYGPPNPGDGPGTYGTYPEKGSISASSAVVSVLIPTTAIYPGGNDGDSWVSATLLVPSATAVSLDELFATPSVGMAALANAARTQILSTSACVQQDYNSDDFGGTKHLDEGISPSAANYHNFALSPVGLVLGFDQGQLAIEACDAQTTTIAWSQLTPFLSKLGQQVVSELR